MILLVYCAMQLLTTHASIIHDQTSQSDIDELKYCEVDNCHEGAHVMCVKYQPHEAMGPICANGQIVNFTQNTQTYILELVNGFRMKAARGQETGKDGELLPKAYLMNELEWDDQLANFARVLAGSCILRNDMCRATEKFHNPGQYGGFMRFSYPDWQFLNKKHPKTDKILTLTKILHTINAVLNGLYQFKRYATKALIEKHGERNIYMTMVHGWSTHIGCGMSTYVEYHPTNDAIFNILLFFCNFSHQPTNVTYDGKVYETEVRSDTTTTTPTITTPTATTPTSTTPTATTPTITTPTATTPTSTTPTATTSTITTPTATTPTITIPTTTTPTITTPTATTPTITTPTATTSIITTPTATTPTTPYPTYPTVPNSNKLCRPFVAVMPIFKVENASPEKLRKLEEESSVSSVALRRFTSDCMNSPDDYLHARLGPTKKIANLETVSKPNEMHYRDANVSVRPRYFGEISLVPPLKPDSIMPETGIDEYYISLLQSLSYNNTQYDKNGFQYTTLYNPPRRNKYTIRNRQFRQTSITPWTRNYFITSHNRGFGHATMNRGPPSFEKKKSIFLRAPRFKIQNVKWSNGLQNQPQPVKNEYLFTPRSKNALHKNRYSTRRSNVDIPRRNFTHLERIASDYYSFKRGVFNKLNYILNKGNSKLKHK